MSIEILTNKQVISEIRSVAKKAGLTFRRHPNLTISSAPAYQFVVRGGGDVAMTNCTLGSAYNNCCSGYISSWDGKRFAGI